MTVTESGCELYVRGQDWRKASPPREQFKTRDRGQICLLMLRHAPGTRTAGLWPYSFEKDLTGLPRGKRKKKHDA